MAAFMKLDARNSVLAGLVAAAALVMSSWTAAAGSDIRVTMNEARIVKLPRPADTIIVGNSEIADAAVQDASTVVLTGRGFGVTNLVILDAEGRPIVDEQVVVSRQAESSVRVYRRSDVQTLSCTPFCESAQMSEAERTSDYSMGMQ